MSLVTLAQVRVLVKAANVLTDTQLQFILDDLEAEVTRLVGAHYTDGATTVSMTVAGGGRNLYLVRPLASVTSITDEDSNTYTSATYRLWSEQGRIEAQPSGVTWLAGLYTVVGVPVDDNAKRREVIINLVRLELERTAMQSENIAGEYSYTAPDWELQRRRLLKRLQYVRC